MFRNYIKVTIRNIASRKLYSALNVFGLVIGITCTLIIIVYLNHELGYDNFHTNSNSIYRVIVRGKLKGEEFNIATTSGIMSKHIVAEVPISNHCTRIAHLDAWLVANDSVRFNEDKILFADSNFFSFFDGFNVLDGNLDSILILPRSIVLTESTARKYFGTTDNIVGKKLVVESREKQYKITGIVADPPTNSHFQFDMLASICTFDDHLSYSWLTNNVYTYINVENKELLNEAIGSINTFFEKYIHPEMVSMMDDVFDSGDSYYFELQPLKRIHLYSDLEVELGDKGNVDYVYILGIAAAFILIIACFNFMNLSTANSINRSFEVSLRKIVGASRKKLIMQFLVESVMYSLIALVIALLLSELLLPYFNKLFDLSLEFGIFKNFVAILLILLFTTGIGILAGSYPAFFVSNYDPIQIINSRQIHELRSNIARSVFVVFQLLITIVIIVLSVIIVAQTRFMLNIDPGYEKENLLIVRRSDALKDNLAAFKDEALKNDGVEYITNSNSIPGRKFYINTFKLREQDEETALLLNQVFVGYDFFETYRLRLKDGRFFNISAPNDTISCIINETAAKKMGLTNTIGAELIPPSLIKRKFCSYEVVGIVEDFHYQSLENEIEPLIICLMPGNWEGFLTIKIKDEDVENTVSFIEKKWHRYAPDYPFISFFLADDFNNNYKTQISLSRLFIVFSVIAVFVVFLGIYGLVAYSANQRIKEVGIRKTLGAPVLKLFVLLARRLFFLLSISSIIAFSVSIYLAGYWLDHFYYMIEQGVLPYIIAFVAVTVLLVATIVYHTRRVIKKSPGITLRI